ncbi:MAG: NAD-glutamate dehydrogenase [Deltaproteobacteria bacterium]|nr:NAD-glutamate dehydrogenase [Deltaproteobacteria bacterium]
MEERDRAVAPPLPSADPPKLRDTIDEVRNRVAPGERPLAEGLVRQLLDRSGSDLLQGATVAELAFLALTMFRFLVDGGRDEPRVAILAPTADAAGWSPPPLVLQTRMRDRPFIVETVEDCLREAGCTIRRLLHPIFRVERDSRGALLAISSSPDLGHTESLLYVESERVADPQALTQQIRDRLGDVVLATNDYQAMRLKAEQLADELRTRTFPFPWNADIDELAAFLDWLGDKNFVFLGYREYQFSGQGAERTGVVRAGSGLGLLRKESQSNYVTSRPLPDLVRRHLSEPPLQMMSKTNAESTIHRRAPMDYIGIKEIDNAGVVIGERRFIGLFTARAYAQEPMTVPLLRLKLAAILEDEGATEASHSYKQIVAAFNSMPRVELLALGIAELHATIKTIVGAAGSLEIRVGARRLCRRRAAARTLFGRHLQSYRSAPDRDARRREGSRAPLVDRRQRPGAHAFLFRRARRQHALDPHRRATQRPAVAHAHLGRSAARDPARRPHTRTSGSTDDTLRLGLLPVLQSVDRHDRRLGRHRRHRGARGDALAANRVGQPESHSRRRSALHRHQAVPCRRRAGAERIPAGAREPRLEGVCPRPRRPQRACHGDGSHPQLLGAGSPRRAHRRRRRRAATAAGPADAVPPADRERSPQRAHLDGRPGMAPGRPAARLRVARRTDRHRPQPRSDDPSAGGPPQIRSHRVELLRRQVQSARPDTATRSRQAAAVGSASEIPRNPGRSRERRRGSDAARPAQRRRRKRADDVLSPGRRTGRSGGHQARLPQATTATAAATDLRDLRPRPGSGRPAPARRQSGARRVALERSRRRFPHRDPRPHAHADGQELGDRAGGRQRRLHRQATSRNHCNRGAGGRGVSYLRQHAARPHRQHRPRPRRVAGRNPAA